MRFLAHGPGLLILEGLGGKSGDNRSHDLLLEGKKIGVITIKPLGPDMGAFESINEFGVDAHPIAGFLNAAFQDIAYIQFLSDLFDVYGVAFVHEDAVAGDNQQFTKT